MAVAFFLRVERDGNGDRHALVAAAAVDDDRHCAAVHSRVAARGRCRAQAKVEVRVAVFERLADARAPEVLEAFFGDGQVALDLPLENVRDILEVDMIRVIEDILNAERIVLLVAVFNCGLLQLVEHLTVFRDRAELRVAVDNLNGNTIVSGLRLDDDVQYVLAVEQLHLYNVLLEQAVELFAVRVRHIRQNLHAEAGLAADCADENRRLDAGLAAGLRNGDRLYILNDIAGAVRDKMIRASSKQLRSVCGTIGDGNGLGAAKRHLKLLAEDRSIHLISFFYANVSHSSP